MIQGIDPYRYELDEGWGKGYKLGVVTGIAIDSQDRVHVVVREPHPTIVVFDRDGQFLASWGEDVFPQPHGIWVDADDRVYITDTGDHTLRICTADGKVLQTLGTPGQTGAPGRPFNRPTRAAVAPSGEIYVSDGYGQNWVHRFSPDCTLLHSWGGEGSGPGQFTLPHSIFVSQDGRVWVADREPNQRIQIFDAEGTYQDEWPGRLSPCDLYVDAENAVYITEGGAGAISIFSEEGRLLSCWDVRGGPDDKEHGPHSIWVDRHGDVYVGEVGVENLLYKFARV